MLIPIILVVLLTVSFIAHLFVSKAETILDSTHSGPFLKLQHQYFIVYCLATFSDWLQGPYIYQVYSYYGYTEPEIATLYITGFLSSMIFGTGVGILADKFGRKRLCIVYSFLYAASCFTKAFSNYSILMVGRILGGICTSILFSTFEAWYVHQHVEKLHLPSQWINITLSKATFYNGVLAIVAGVVANIMADWAKLGPVSPFIFAIPCLVISGILTMQLWEENNVNMSHTVSYNCSSLMVICSSRNRPLLYLGLIQSLFESVMYTFVFLWTPVLESMTPPLGIVFSCFMVCIMIGSSIYSFLLTKNHTPEKLLSTSLITAFVALMATSLAMLMITSKLEYTIQYTRFAFVSFLLYEISVGIYFPAIGYLRSQIIPEQYRASIANWYRVPMNLFTCASLFWIKNVAHIGKEFAFETAVSSLKDIPHMSPSTFLCFIIEQNVEKRVRKHKNN